MLKLIKDPVVGNTVLSEIESAILEMPVLNRLHHLMQNGLAYRVFPSDTTSRFEHSIGVMHLAGEMYCRSMANALPRTRDRFLLKAWRTVLAPAKGMRNNNSDNLLSEASSLPQMVAEVMGPEFINHHPGPNLSFRVPHLRAAHALLLQAVRLAGLLHDVGHFPCSHLFEDALRLMACHGLSEDLKDHLAKIRTYVTDLAPALENSALHEQAGFLVARAILYERLAQGGRTTAVKEAVAKRVVLATLRILGHKETQHSSGSVLGALSELLCGDLDADRLDFVLRDGRRTGLVTASGDVDRILKMMSLTENENGFRFCPAVQTLNDVQQYLLDRLRLYQYVYSHHRVWRLENMLKYAIRVMLKYPGFARDQLTDLFADLESLGGELKPALLSKTLGRIAQRTDHWLLSLVHHARQEVMQRKEKERIEELISGTKTWTSLWKKDFEYRNFLIKAVRYWLQQDDKLIWQLEQLLLNTSGNIIEPDDEHQRNLVKLEALKSRPPDTLDENSLSWLGSIAVRTILSRAEPKLVCQQQIPHAMICPTRFYSGVKNLSLVDIKNDQRPRQDFAQLATGMRYFQRTCERGIAMHVFIRKDCDRKVAVQKVADLLFKALISLVRQPSTEETIRCEADVPLKDH